MELFLTNLVPDQLIKALCNTLMHSLWQGLILAAIAGLVIVLTKKSGAALRYNLMIGLLVLFSVAATITFFMQLEKAGRINVTPLTVIATSPVSQVAAVNVQPTEKPASLLANCVNYFNMHSDTVVLIWFLIICARCIQLGAGLHHIYYIRRTKVLSPGTLWEDRVNELAETLGIKSPVALLQSGVVKLPMVLGHFKPVILIPIGLLTALSTEEVESILVHELAHIHRRDYLVNILQNLMEIVFFFNPAFLWVSAIIKAERENCCDDIVVAHTSSKVSYIKALVSCQEYQSAMPAYAMGLGGQNDHFLQRVKRMLSNNNQTLNKVEKMVLTICLISAVLLTAAFSKANKTTSAKVKAGATKTRAGKYTGIKASTPTAIPGEKQLNKTNAPTADGVKNLVATLADEKTRAQWKDKTNVSQWKTAFTDTIKRNAGLTALDTQKAIAAYKAGRIDSGRTVYYYNNSKKSNKAYSKSHKNYSDKSTYYYSDDAIPSVPAVPAVPTVPPMPPAPGIPAAPTIPASPAIPAVPPIPAIPPLPPANSKIADELIREHLVKDRKNFTFSINDDYLYIDGMKQSDELHNRIMKKFVQPGGSINMTYSIHGDSKTININ